MLVRQREECRLSTIRDALLELVRLPGARYSCVAERAGGTVLSECGTGPVDPAVVVQWARDAERFLGLAADGGLEDLIATSGGSYHLVRPLPATPPMLVYLCLDRKRANLALARRELAAVRWADPVSPIAEPPLPPANSWLWSARVPASVAPPSGPSGGPAGTLTAPPTAAVPLPRRSSVRALPPPPPLPRQRVAPDPQLPGRWADDLGTMRRLLSALRAFR